MEKKGSTWTMVGIPPELKRAIAKTAIDEGVSLRELTLRLWKDAAKKYLETGT